MECYELLEKIYNPLLDRISSHRDLLSQSISLLPRCLIQSELSGEYNSSRFYG